MATQRALIAHAVGTYEFWLSWDDVTRAINRIEIEITGTVRVLAARVIDELGVEADIVFEPPLGPRTIDVGVVADTYYVGEGRGGASGNFGLQVSA